MPVVVDQVNQSGLQIIPKPSSLGRCAVEVAPQESHDEFLAKIFGRRGLTNRSQKVTVGRPAVTSHQSLPHSVDRILRWGVGGKHHRPARGDATEPLIWLR